MDWGKCYCRQQYSGNTGLDRVFFGTPREECHPAIELSSRQETRKLQKNLPVRLEVSEVAHQSWVLATAFFPEWPFLLEEACNRGGLYVPVKSKDSETKNTNDCGLTQF